jgi:hypothetical protein
MLLPSGDHDGSMDTPGTGSVVTASVESVTMAMTEASLSSLRVNAICVP